MSVLLHLQNVLIVGGCGFLGHRIAAELQDLTPTPHISVLDMNTTHNRLPSVDYYNGDITSKSEVQAVIRKVRPQVIIHTASPPPVSGDVKLYMKVNVDGTQNLVDCAQACGTVKAFVYTSSASVLHDAVSDLADGDESLPLVYLPEQREPYSHSKAIADALVLNANRNGGDMLTVSIRPSGIFGENDMSMMKSMIETAAAGKTRFQMGGGQNLFDFTYVGNVVHAHILAAQRLLEASHASTPLCSTERVDGEAFLITNDEPILFWDFARRIGAAAGYPVRNEDIIVIPRVVGLVIAFVVEWVTWITSFGRRKPTMTRTAIRYSCMTRTFRIDKAKRILGYQPRVSMQEAINRGVASFPSLMKKKE